MRILPGTVLTFLCARPPLLFSSLEETLSVPSRYRRSSQENHIGSGDTSVLVSRLQVSRLQPGQEVVGLRSARIERARGIGPGIPEPIHFVLGIDYLPLCSSQFFRCLAQASALDWKLLDPPL